MLILGIESSCDETAASVVRSGKTILSSVVASQDSVHARYGGVVPELASRRHIENIIPVIKRALKNAPVSLKDIEGIAVTKGPGLVGSLLIGLSVAKSISYSMKAPLVGINHIEAHLMAVNLSERPPEYPYVGMVVSGGHTSLYLLKGPTDLTLLGKTRDDAAGEAFDKVAKLLGLGYPGGIQIEKISRGITSTLYLPRPMSQEPSLDLSFSGLKTSVLNIYKKENKVTDELKRDISAGFQDAVVDILTQKLRSAMDMTGVKRAVICGGVAANEKLRRSSKDLERSGYEVSIPPKDLCTDNAAMVAALGYIYLSKGSRDGLKLNARANLESI